MVNSIVRFICSCVKTVYFLCFPTVDDAVEKLLDLSPFDLKHLLLLIFSSKEFTVDESKFSPSPLAMPIELTKFYS